jgi:hypothetical protein
MDNTMKGLRDREDVVFKNITADKLVAQVAVELAGIQYEVWASKSNAFYKKYPDVTFFIKKFSPNFVNIAKAVLGNELNRTDLGETEKEFIAEALRRQASIPRNMVSMVEK